MCLLTLCLKPCKLVEFITPFRKLLYKIGPTYWNDWPQNWVQISSSIIREYLNSVDYLGCSNK